MSRRVWACPNCFRVRTRYKSDRSAHVCYCGRLPGRDDGHLMLKAKVKITKVKKS